MFAQPKPKKKNSKPERQKPKTKPPQTKLITPKKY
jgi:hypothetical protein